MSGGDTRKVTSEEIQMVQNRIEQCLRRYMSREEVIKTLFIEDHTEPRFTQIVWQRLEEENQEFFKAYFLKLMVKEQILRFNQLLSKQVALMRQLGQSAIPSLPVSNGSHISSIYQNSRFHVTDGIDNSVPSNLPNAFNNCVQPMGNVSAQNGKIDVNPNILLAQPSNVGMTSTMNGNLIKLEPSRSPFDFGVHGNLFEPCSVMGDASISSFSSVESNTQHPNEALLDADTSWIPQNFNFDLAADFHNNSDLLESYSSPPFLTNDTGNLLDSNGDIERFNNSSGLRYKGFSGD